jgi:hypothetical protein
MNTLIAHAKSNNTASTPDSSDRAPPPISYTAVGVECEMKFLIFHFLSLMPSIFFETVASLAISRFSG